MTLPASEETVPATDAVRNVRINTLMDDLWSVYINNDPEAPTKVNQVWDLLDTFDKEVREHSPDIELKSHLSAWRNALVIAKEHAEVSLPDIDDKAYWQHEINALDAYRLNAKIGNANRANDLLSQRVERLEKDLEKVTKRRDNWKLRWQKLRRERSVRIQSTREQAVRECAEIAASDERSDMAKEHKYQPHWFIHAKRIEQRILSLIDRSAKP